MKSDRSVIQLCFIRVNFTLSLCVCAVTVSSQPHVQCVCVCVCLCDVLLWLLLCEQIV